MEEERRNGLCIMNLPAEMRGLIFNKLPQNEVFKTLTVCKQWAEEVLEFFEFSIVLHEQKMEKMEKVRELKIKECRVWFFYTPPPISPSRTSFFKYPKFIRKLNIETSRISPTNFQNLMQECSQYLEELIIHLTDFDEEQLLMYGDGPVEADLIASYPLSLGSDFNLQNLRKFELSEERVYSDALLSGLENDIFLRLLRNPSITKLTSLTVGWDMYYSYDRYLYEIENNVALQLSGAIISLIARQWKTLQTLYIDDPFNLFKNAEATPLSILEMTDTTLWGKVDSLKSIYFEALVEDKIPRAHDLNTWSDCLRNQKRLESINLRYTILYPLFLQIVDVNFATLSDVSVHLTFQGHPKGPLDMSIFRSCVVLQELQLGLHCERVAGTPTQKQWDIINLRELPKCIKELTLFSFGVSFEELDAFFSQSKEFKSLKSFILVGHERSGKPKVNGYILEKVLDSPAILYFKISSTLGFGTSNDGKRKKLKAVFKRFNEKYDHGKLRRRKYLAVSRDSIDKPFRLL